MTQAPTTQRLDQSRTVASNATLEDVVDLLRADRARMVDVVASAGALRAGLGMLLVSGVEPVVTEDGVTVVNGMYVPTEDCDASIATRLDIPVGYLRRLRANHIDLYDSNVEGWLQHESMAAKRFLLRAFADEGGGSGVARALLSDAYLPLDHLDVLFTVLESIRDNRIDVKVDACHLTDRRFYVELSAPDVVTYAPKWLENYRDPRTGNRGKDNPAVSAGILLTNSETGHGSFSLTPYLKVLVCSNGQTVTKDAVSRQHLGARLPEGVVRWDERVQRAALTLVKEQTRQAVTTFLDVEYMKGVVAEIEAKAGAPVADPEATIKAVVRRLSYTEHQQAAIMRYFLRGADDTAGGVMQAVTAAAQDYEPDVRFAMEADAFQVLALASVTR